MLNSSTLSYNGSTAALGYCVTAALCFVTAAPQHDRTAVLWFCIERYA
jgi:hypothetical protein